MVSKLLFPTLSLIFSSTLISISPAVAQVSTQSAKLETAVPAPAAPTPLTAVQRGDVFMARKNYRDAIDAYGKQKPMTAVVYNKIGIAYHQLYELDSARKNYERAVKLDPKFADGWNNLGTVFYAQKRYRPAISRYKKALELRPESATMHSNLGTAYFARKDMKNAMLEYDKALSIDPDVFEHTSTFGVTLQERNVEEKAKFHYYLAKSYAKSGANDRALLYLRKAIEEGYPERQKMLTDEEFAGMRETPEFKELLDYHPPIL